jgi:15-cis-phytoene synthase
MPTLHLPPEDLRRCQALLDQGSKSFAAASRLLPRRLRPAVTAMYAFCRAADDAVDLGRDKAGAVDLLEERLDAMLVGRPADDPVDRCFAAVLQAYCIPRALPAALLEGFLWDAERRRYPSLEALEGYTARVASSVGVMMTLLMGPREPGVLARACDLGLAMQLTNIARDVGEDARAGRVYLPLDWLAAAGLDADQLIARPAPGPALAAVVARLLLAAEELYQAADLGIAHLPRDCRVAIRGARLIYADIGREIARAGFDSVRRRAYTSRLRKAVLLLQALPATTWQPSRGGLELPPRPAARFLVDAVAGAQK